MYPGWLKGYVGGNVTMHFVYADGLQAVCVVVIIHGTLSPISVPSLCADNNGGCSDLCLLSSQFPSGYNCSCRSGYNIDETGFKCECK